MSDDTDRATLVAVLEALPCPALIITATGFVLHANAAAEARFEADPGLVARIASGDEPGVDATPIPDTGDLLVRLTPRQDLEAQIARAIERWSLTRSEARVLRALAIGASYTEMATSLGLTTRTVEFHVSKILAKANLESSAQLIAAITRA